MVNEEGSEAAAVTVAGGNCTTFLGPAEYPKATFHANRPFVYVIQERSSGVILFAGKFTGKSDLESTIFKVNKEATVEIAKQLRLHDIGGIIIIDYIDMQDKENDEKIENLLKEELKKDRAKTQVEGFTKLNLMEMTRKHICSHLDEI